MSTKKKLLIKTHRAARIANNLSYVYLKPQPEVPNFEWGIRDLNGEVAIKGKMGTISLLEKNQDKLQNLDLSGEVICKPRMNSSVVWVNCRFNGSAFRYCKFIGHIFIDCDFTNVRMRGVYFFKCEFIRCKFDGLRLNTTYRTVRNCFYFCKIDSFKYAKITQKANVICADFFGSTLTNTIFHPEDSKFFRLNNTTLNGALKMEAKKKNDYTHRQAYRQSLIIMKTRNKKHPDPPPLKPAGAVTFTNQEAQSDPQQS